MKAGDVTVVADLSLEGEVEIGAFGVDMVYIPEGSFVLGWDNNQTNAFYRYSEDGRTDIPYRVTGPGAIPTSRKTGLLWARGAAADTRHEQGDCHGGPAPRPDPGQAYHH